MHICIYENTVIFNFIARDDFIEYGHDNIPNDNLTFLSGLIYIYCNAERRFRSIDTKQCPLSCRSVDFSDD